MSLAEILEGGDIMGIVSFFIALALVAASILCVIYIIVGGISFILSAGNEEKVKAAVGTIRYAIIGLIISFLAFFLVRIIAALLGIPFELTFGDIIGFMQTIIDSIQ
jgi:hypothetical protein